MPSTIQIALLAEATLNVPAIVSLTLFPSRTLSYFLASPLPSLELNATAILLARGMGLLILALTPQLLLAYPESKDCEVKRKLAYITLGVGEAALIPLLLWEAFRAGDEQKAAGVWAGGWTKRASLLSVASLVPLLMWRGFLFQIRPEWFAGGATAAQTKKKR